MTELEAVRSKIDKIDSKVLKLLRQRESLVKSVAKLKHKSKKPITDKARESKILSKAKDGYELAILKKVISESKKAQRGL